MQTAPSNNTSAGRLQLAVAASFLLTVVCCWKAAFSFIGLAMVPALIISMICGLIVSGILGRIVAKLEHGRHDKILAEIRADREADKITQIDEMLRGNANISQVGK